MPGFRASSRLVSILVVALIAAIGLAGPAEANEGVVNGAPSASWQTNGNVLALAYANGVIYVGGEFTSVRPPGAALGTGEVRRNHLAAFDASTGDLLPFDPDLDG